MLLIHSEHNLRVRKKKTNNLQFHQDLLSFLRCFFGLSFLFPLYTGVHTEADQFIFLIVTFIASLEIQSSVMEIVNVSSLYVMNEYKVETKN